MGSKVALGLHVLLAVMVIVKLQYQFGNSNSLSSMGYAILMCCGFVALKLVDLELPKFHIVFNYLSGHFLSKICDCMQIHFFCEFIFNLNCSKVTVE